MIYVNDDCVIVSKTSRRHRETREMGRPTSNWAIKQDGTRPRDVRMSIFITLHSILHSDLTSPILFRPFSLPRPSLYSQKKENG